MTDPTREADGARDEALARLEALEHELEALADTVRQSVSRLRGEIAHARGGVHELHSRAAAAGVLVVFADAGGEPADPPAGHAEPTPLHEPPVGGDAPEGAEDGARLVALDLVTRGTDRDEALARLSESFPGVDAGRVYDEAAAALGG